MTTGEKLRALRISAGLSQSQLALRMGGYTKHDISAIETGSRNVGKNLEKKFAHACGFFVETQYVPHKVLDLDHVFISQQVLDAWLAKVESGVLELRNRYSDLNANEIGDEQLRMLPNGDAELFVWVRGVELNLLVPSQQWRALSDN